MSTELRERQNQLRQNIGLQSKNDRLKKAQEIQFIDMASIDSEELANNISHVERTAAVNLRFEITSSFKARCDEIKSRKKQLEEDYNAIIHFLENTGKKQFSISELEKFEKIVNGYTPKFEILETKAAELAEQFADIYESIEKESSAIDDDISEINHQKSDSEAVVKKCVDAVGQFDQSAKIEGDITSWNFSIEKSIQTTMDHFAERIKDTEQKLAPFNNFFIGWIYKLIDSFGENKYPELVSNKNFYEKWHNNLQELKKDVLDKKISGDDLQQKITALSRENTLDNQQWKTLSQSVDSINQKTENAIAQKQTVSGKVKESLIDIQDTKAKHIQIIQNCTDEISALKKSKGQLDKAAKLMDPYLDNAHKQEASPQIQASKS